MAIKDSQQRANAKYRAKAYDRIETLVRKDGGDGITKEEIDLMAKEQGKSRTEYILDAIKEYAKK